MGRIKRLATVGVALMVAGVTVAACGGAGAGPAAPVGDPQRGGTATLLALSEPLRLDPAKMQNRGAVNGPVGDAIYGQLLLDTPDGEIRPAIAESLTTQDGTSWTLRIPAGRVFSDGTAFDAAAVEANWKRHQDPAVASTAASIAKAITSFTVVDPTTLRFTLGSPNVHYGLSITSSTMNWIAAPGPLTSLSPEQFDAGPVGAGPFVLQEWSRQNQLVLNRNDRYHDAPRPYLDTLIIKGVGDTEQRLRAVQTGGADAMMSTNPEPAARGEAAGLKVTHATLFGGQAVRFNVSKAPFDDPDTRRAVVQAVDLVTLNKVLTDGKAPLPTHLFVEQSPYYAGELALPTHDPEAAQAVFDDLAAQGRPLSFTLTTPNASEAVTLAQNIQTQLRGFRNVQVEVSVVDLASQSAIMARGDFEMMPFAVLGAGPDPILYDALRGGSSLNFSRVDDPEMNAALDTSRTTADPAAIDQAYRTVQERFIALNPMLFYTQPDFGVVSTQSVQGVEFYGNFTPVVAGLWLAS